VHQFYVIDGPAAQIRACRRWHILPHLGPGGRRSKLGVAFWASEIRDA
jgi:hypothetical protein